MEIQQPENGIKLPKEIQKRIEDGRNHVTILESEGKRLSKLNFNLERGVSVLNDRSKFLEDEIEELENEKGVLKDRISKDKLVSSKLESDTQVAESRNKEETKAIQEERDLLDEDKREADSKSKELDERELTLTEKEKHFDKEKKDHATKVQKIKEAIS